MTPRSYSISSSSTTSPKQVAITVAVAVSPTTTPAPTTPTTSTASPQLHIPGLTSTYLSNFHTSSLPTPPPSLYSSIHRSTFKLPSASVPLLLIGAGTGIAPLRAFLHERATLAHLNPSTPPAPILFIYGCRNASIDNLYASELEALMSESGPLKGSLEILIAESRPSPCPSSSTKGQYVQSLISTPSIQKQISQLLLADSGAVFFCGSTKMARAAGGAILDAVRVNSHLASGGNGVKIESEEEALAWREERRRVGRWREDVWG